MQAARDACGYSQLKVKDTTCVCCLYSGGKSDGRILFQAVRRLLGQRQLFLVWGVLSQLYEVPIVQSKSSKAISGSSFRN